MGGDRWPDQWASEDFCYVTTTGRRTRRPHRIEIWFAVHGGHVYMLADKRERADWIRNILVDPRVRVQLGDETREGLGRALEPGSAEDALARRLLVEKYTPVEDGLDEWGRTALPVAIDFPPAANSRVDD